MANTYKLIFNPLTGNFDEVVDIVDAAKIADGSVSNTEFQYLDGVTSDIQTQIDSKQPTGNYITDLTGDVVANGPGSVASTAQPAMITGKTSLSAVALDDLLLISDTSASAALRKSQVSDIFSALPDTASSATWVTADGTSKSFTHNLNTLDVAVSVYDIASGETILVDTITRTSVDAVTLTASSAPPAGGWRINVISGGAGLSIGGGGGGSVTSVALSLPAAVFSVSGSPVTTTGTLTGSFATQTANFIWAGPTTGAAAIPTFRALVQADIPDTLVIDGGTF